MFEIKVDTPVSKPLFVVYEKQMSFMASDTSYTTSDVLSDDRIPSHYPSTTTTNDETTNNFKQSIKMSTSTQPNQITTTQHNKQSRTRKWKICWTVEEFSDQKQMIKA